MTRKIRTEILVHCSLDFLQSLAFEAKQQYPVTVIEKPHLGLVMMNVRETAQQSQFYAGEVLTSACKVRIGETFGLGLIQNIRLEEAEALAVIDACYNANLPIITQWEERIIREKNHLDSKRREAVGRVLATVVNFESMDQE